MRGAIGHHRLTLGMAQPALLITFALVAACGLSPHQTSDPSPSVPANPFSFVVGLEREGYGSVISIVDSRDKSARDVRVGIWAEAAVVGSSRVSIAVTEDSISDPDVANLLILDAATLDEVGRFPIPGRTAANIPGTPTFTLSPEMDRAYVIVSGEDGYSQSLHVIDLVGGQQAITPVPLGYCGPGYVGIVAELGVVGVVCPEPRTAFLMRPDLSEFNGPIRIASKDVDAWASGAAFGERQITVCLTRANSTWRSATVVVEADGTVGPTNSISDDLSAAPSACTMWPDGRISVGLWHGQGVGGYDTLAIVSATGIRVVELDAQVIGPVSRVGNMLIAASADGQRALWFDESGSVKDKLAGIHATGGLFP